MAQTVKVALSMLGWHGVFLLLLIVSFKLFLAEQDSTVCPRTWNVAYSTLMFVIPSLISYLIAVFAYFRQDDDSAPWKALRKLYVFKGACHLYDERRDWNFHAEHCISCKQLNRDWSLVKIACQPFCLCFTPQSGCRSVFCKLIITCALTLVHLIHH